MIRVFMIFGMLALLTGLTAGCGAMGAHEEFSADLQGTNEVPPVTTDASGSAIFWPGPDELTLHYKLIVHDLKDVTMAHLHTGTTEENGDHIAWLYPSAPPPVEQPGTYDGTLMQGALTANELVDKMKGKSIADLIQMIKRGDIYVNVHTKQHPDGEIRGQVG